ncbi:MAG: hypothetical protein R2856_04360 [Caldilineaceae bacterium]
MARYLMERGHKVVSLDIADFDYPERSGDDPHRRHPQPRRR